MHLIFFFFCTCSSSSKKSFSPASWSWWKGIKRRKDTKNKNIWELGDSPLANLNAPLDAPKQKSFLSPTHFPPAAREERGGEEEEATPPKNPLTLKWGSLGFISRTWFFFGASSYFSINRGWKPGDRLSLVGALSVFRNNFGGGLFVWPVWAWRRDFVLPKFRVATKRSPTNCLLKKEIRSPKNGKTIPWLIFCETRS